MARPLIFDVCRVRETGQTGRLVKVVYVADENGTTTFDGKRSSCYGVIEGYPDVYIPIDALEATDGPA